jgi:hypothetical protein
MFFTPTRPNERPILTLREGATVFALVVLIPAAIQGLLAVVLWVASGWGRSIEWAGGTSLAPLVAALIILTARYFAFAAWWVWLAQTHGKRWSVGLLAALPVVGLIWAIWIASHVARSSQAMPQRLPGRVITLSILTLVSILLLPFSMITATAQAQSELDRLAQPCLAQDVSTSPPPQPDSVAATAGPESLTLDEVAAYSTQVASAQRGTVAQRDPLWPQKVTDQFLRIVLIEQWARQTRTTATIGSTETLAATLGGSDGQSGAMQEAARDGVPEELFERYLCATLLEARLQGKEWTSADPDGEEPLTFEQAFAAFSATQNVTVNPSIGYWNPSLVKVQSLPPLESEVTTTDREGLEPAVEVTFGTRVEYPGTQIPTQEELNTLKWQADLCVGAVGLLQERYSDLIRLYERVGGAWRNLPQTKYEVDVQQGGRCSAEQVNVLVRTEASPPPVNWINKDWRTCTNYQVRLPETPNFSATAVNLCVSTRADAESEEQQ